jgi:signal transduction histidine kinase/ligand-binding sensor domain-containing protein
MKRRVQLFCITLAATLILGQRAAAESPFVVEVWNTADGLPQSSVITITQTRDGYLWLGTLNGLVRFDGNAFTRFNANNSAGLPSNGIVFLFEDSHTNLWVGTDNGALSLVQAGEFKQVYAGGGAGGRITAAFDDQNGNVWFVTDARQILCWRQGTLDTHPAVYPGQRDFFTYLAFHLIVPSRQGGSWQLQNGQVGYWRGDKAEKNFGAPPWTNAIVTAAGEDDAGNLIVGTRGQGVFWFDAAGNYTHITQADGLSQNYVLGLYFDGEKNLWVGTDGGGLDRVRKKVFNVPAGLAGGVAQSVAEDAQGGVWTAFNLRGVTHWTTNGVQTFDTPLNAWSVLVDQHQEAWVGTSGGMSPQADFGQGLYHWVDGRFQLVPAALPAGAKVFALCETRDGRIWVGGENGLAVFDGQRWSYFSERNGLPKSPVRALAAGAAGQLWIGTESEGLLTLQDGSLTPVAAPIKDVSVLLPAADGALWVGSFVHGLARRAPSGEWKVLSSTTNGLANDDIGSLAEDAAGNLWIGSYEGLVRVDQRSLANVLAGKARTLSCRTFLTRECSAGAQPAALRARDGRLWFPTTEGVVTVNPAELPLNTNPPPVIIESVLVDGMELKSSALVSGWQGEVRLTPRNEQLEIRFTALMFSAPKGSRFGAKFRYALSETDRRGHIQNWTEIGSERGVHFNRLTPGKYYFEVAACNEDGVWNQTGARLTFTVEPPFWRRPGFIAASVVTLLGVLAGAIYLVSTAKLKRQLRIAQQKELIEKERARIARDLHDQLGANLTQIALLGELAEMDKELPNEVEEHAQRICVTARETTRSLDEIVWAVNPANDTLEGLTNYACKYAQDYFALAGVSYRSELPTQLPPTPILPEVRHNVFLAFKEAVNNVVKHARATEAHVRLELLGDKFILSVTDNGRGPGNVKGKTLRNGLKNMRKRLSDVHGEFDIAPGPVNGTIVTFTVPVVRQQANAS